MKTNTLANERLPTLRLGCMRFPMDESRAIKKDEVAEMVAYAMANGVNYFDTGYDYHGDDEEVIGFAYETLDRYIRTGSCEDAAARERIDSLERQNRFKLRLMPTFFPEI